MVPDTTSSGGAVEAMQPTLPLPLDRLVLLHRDPITSWQIVLVGAGGIGAWLVPMLKGRATTVVIVDPDHVEPRNLHRQAFTPDEVGMPKATALADRWATEGFDIIPYVGTFEDYLTDSRADLYFPATAAVVGAVDNGAARATMLQHFLGGDCQCYIDAGSDGLSGQVLLNAWLDAGRVAALVAGYRAYPDLFDPALDRPRQSCALAPIGDTQTMSSNVMASTLVLWYLNWLLAEVTRPPNGGAVRFEGHRFTEEGDGPVPDRTAVISRPPLSHLGIEFRAPAILTPIRLARQNVGTRRRGYYYGGPRNTYITHVYTPAQDRDRGEPACVREQNFPRPACDDPEPEESVSAPAREPDTHTDP